MSKRLAICIETVAIVSCLLVFSAVHAKAQQMFSPNANGSFMKCTPLQQPLFHITQVTPQEDQEIQTLHRIQLVITTIFQDDVKGIHDPKKYDEVRKLVAKLPGTPPKEKKKKK